MHMHLQDSSFPTGHSSAKPMHGQFLGSLAVQGARQLQAVRPWVIDTINCCYSFCNALPGIHAFFNYSCLSFDLAGSQGNGAASAFVGGYAAVPQLVFRYEQWFLLFAGTYNSPVVSDVLPENC
jgi:hypothetical protein